MPVKQLILNTFKYLLTILSFVLPLFFIILTSNVAKSQNLDKKITIIAKNKPLSDVLKEITRQSGIEFSYSTDLINASQPITLIARKKSVETIFSALFHENNIDYIQIENKLILKPYRREIPNDENLNETKISKRTLSGFVRDKIDGEAIIGASVSVTGTATGTVTNAYGFFSLSLPVGTYLISFSFPGYEKTVISLNLNTDTKINQVLNADEQELSVVVINTDDRLDVINNNPTKRIKLNASDICRNTGLAGEADVVKSLHWIPGVQSSGDGSVLYNVRGGDKDQNIIYIDEAPVYNPSHLLGFFSAISPDAVNSMKVYKSSVPIEYGGSLSCFTDIKTKEGNKEHFGFSGKMDPIAVGYTFDGPFTKEKSSYFVSFRKSQINALFGRYLTTEKVSFYDVHTKFNFKMGRKNRIFLSLYSGNDVIQNKQIDSTTQALSWKNVAFSLRYNHLYTDKLFSNTTIYLGKYDYFLYSSIENNKYWNSNISDLSLKNDLIYYINPKHTVRFGININNHNFNPGNYNDEYFMLRKTSESHASEAVIYAGTESSITEKLQISAGLRFLDWNNIGPTVNYSYTKNHQVSDTTLYGQGIYKSTFNLEPRISILWAVTQNSSLKFSYDRSIQYLNLLSNSISPFTSMDVWLPAGINIKPQKSNQWVLAFYKRLSEFEFTGEFYYKKMINQIEYINHANLLVNPLIEGELRFGQARAYGAEFSLSKQKGNFNGQIAYTYSRIFMKIEGINLSNSYPETYDRPHKVNINLSYKTETRWTFTMAWIYSSGTRFSAPTGFYYYHGYSVPIYGKKNNARLPDYHRLDMSVNFRLSRPERRYKHNITLSVFNVYGRKNAVAVNFSKIETENSNFLIPVDYITENQMIPTQTYLLGFIPSVSYSFGFR